MHGGHVVSELWLWAKIILTYYAVETQHRQLFVYLVVHRKMGGFAKYFDTLSTQMVHQCSWQQWNRYSLACSSEAVKIWRSWRWGGHGGHDGFYGRFCYKYYYSMTMGPSFDWRSKKALAHPTHFPRNKWTLKSCSIQIFFWFCNAFWVPVLTLSPLQDLFDTLNHLASVTNEGIKNFFASARL